MVASTTSPINPINTQDLLAPPLKSTQANLREPSFFPVAVWYGGGKARAPMLETITPDSPKFWRDDLLKIKGLGFNAVRTVAANACPR